MRQVDEAELIWAVKLRLRFVSASLRNQLASRQAEARHQAEQILATELVRTALGRYEILSSAALPESGGQRTDLFSRAAYGGGGTGAPLIEGE